jgi:hypothetical protein
VKTSTVKARFIVKITTHQLKSSMQYDVSLMSHNAAAAADDDDDDNGNEDSTNDDSNAKLSYSVSNEVTYQIMQNDLSPKQSSSR